MARLTSPNIAAGTGGNRYTFDVHSDDGFIFRILDSNGAPVTLVSTSRNGADTDGVNGNDAFTTTACCTDSFGRYDLVPGAYTFEVAMQEGGGGSHFQLFGANGDYNTFLPEAFQLVGQNIDGTFQFETVAARPAGLQLVAVPEPATAALFGLAGLSLVARRRRRA